MLIKLSKLFYALLILYFGWFQITFFQIPNMLLILGAGMMGFIILHAILTKTKITNSVTTELMLWILFVFTSFIFGMLVAVNFGYLLSSLMIFCEFLVLMFGIIYISNHDRKIDFFINLFIGYSIICAFTTVFWGVEYGQGRITMGLSNNPNSLGITMVLGVCCILYKHSFKKLFFSIITFSLILLLVYVCLLTGSRKAFLSIVAIFIYWFAFIVFGDIKSLRFIEKLKGIFSILLVIFFGYQFFNQFFADSILLERLTLLFENGSETRESMYSIAFDFFKQSPLVGIGFNNYRALSIFGTYSHSTYSEALACTGIIGSIFYFSAYIKLLINYVRLIMSKKLDALLLKQAKVMLGFFGVLLFLGVGVIHFYEMTSSIAFGMLIAFYNTNIKLIKNGAMLPSYQSLEKNV
ncbi:O-antigen ligase family protein [Peribacillus frigoritolerans]|uniref:O-antigen ligase family protein n=1 Tax=Peribacillus frigoritolerans TaxID=450367 RepID=UPI002E23E5AC|nr:O-antigen ligase family protein [Peribacillus frigoritolerans]